MARKHIYCIAKNLGFVRAGGLKKGGCIQYIVTHLPFLEQALLKINLPNTSIDTNVSTFKKLRILLLMKSESQLFQLLLGGFLIRMFIACISCEFRTVFVRR